MLLKGATLVTKRIPTMPKKAGFASPQASSIFTARRALQNKGGAGLQARAVSNFSSTRITWKRIAFAVKLTRFPILVTAIYTLGYQNGVVETVRNPLKIQQGTFEEICASFGVTDGKEISIVAEKAKQRAFSRIGSIRGSKEDVDPRVTKIANVGREIIRVAQKFVREELSKATANAKASLKDKEDELTEIEYIRLLNGDQKVQEWTNALELIEGYTVDGAQDWQYVLINTPVPNAFVSEMLPQRFFVTTGLFEEFVKNDDELAMILGHEISHLILGHNSRSNFVEFMFRGLEITLLMLDPTEGMLSLLIASFLGSSREAIVASFSRSNETEADQLGCQLAALACFDTARGSNAFKKMRKYDESNGGGRNNLMSSHPASDERYLFVQELAREENYSKHSYCKTLSRRIGRAIKIVRERK